MIASLQIDLTALFGTPCPIDSLCMQPSIRMKTDLITCWKSNLGEAILQEFNGLMGYCYHLELYLAREVSVHITTCRAELHVLYPLMSPYAMHLVDLQEPAPYTLHPQRARYFYLPQSRYRLELPRGRIQLFGFFFRAKLFRNNSERPFRFLHELIKAKREGHTRSLCSVDFMVGPRTQQHIRQLIKNAKMGDFDSEDFVHRQFMELIKLSRKKVYDEYERTSDSEELIKRFRRRIANGVAEDGASLILKDIASQLNTSFEHLCRLHKVIHQTTPLAYRDQLLVNKVKLLLAQPGTLAEISEICKFSDSNSLIRFFRKQTGSTPAQYRTTLHEQSTD